MTNLHYKIILNNNVEYVFDKLFATENYKKWTKPFNPDSAFSGTLATGNEIFFHDADGNGMKAEVTKYEVNKVIEFTYTADVMDGVETKYENSHKNYERYKFCNLQDTMMALDIELYIPAEFESFFEDAWAQAIVIIQDLFDNDDE